MCAGKRKGDVEVGASGTGRKSFVAAPRHASLLHLKEQLYCEQSSGRERVSQMRRRDNNHPFFTRSCGTATTKELSTMEGINSLLQKYQRFHGETLPFSFVFLMSLEKLIVSFLFFVSSSFLLSRYARNWRFILSPRTASYTSFRNFAVEEDDERKENRKNRGTNGNRFRRSSFSSSSSREREVRKMVVVVFANCKRSETNAG